MTEQEYREFKAEINNSGIPLKSQKQILEILRKEVKEFDGEYQTDYFTEGDKH